MIDPRAEMDKFRPAAFMGDANPMLTNLSGPGRSADAGKQQNVGHLRSELFAEAAGLHTGRNTDWQGPRNRNPDWYADHAGEPRDPR